MLVMQQYATNAFIKAKMSSALGEAKQIAAQDEDIKIANILRFEKLLGEFCSFFS